jgi:hypothetical protein
MASIVQWAEISSKPAPGGQTMALVKCRACGTDVAKDAKTCPKCGGVHSSVARQEAFA